MGQRRKVVCVVGSHRSGTSALTNGLQLLGVELGPELMTAKADNPRGFWENPGLVEINDQVLAAGGRDMNSLAPPDLSARSRRLAKLRSRARDHIADQFLQVGVWGFKDPRTSRVLPFWLRLFEELSMTPLFVISVRHPCSVAASIQRRQKMYQQTVFSDARALELWFQYTLDAIGGTQGHQRLVVDYDRMLSAPPRELARIAGALGLEPPARGAHSQARSLFERGLNHHQAQGNAIRLAGPSIGALWDLCAKAASDEVPLEDPAAAATIASLLSAEADRLQLLNEIDAQEVRTRALTDQLPAHLHDAERQIKDLMSGMDQSQTVIHDLMAKLSDSERRVRFLDARLAEGHKLLTERDLSIAQLTRQAQELGGFLADSRQQVSDLGGQVLEISRLLTGNATRLATMTERHLSDREAATSDKIAAEAARAAVEREYLTYRGLTRHRLADRLHGVLVPVIGLWRRLKPDARFDTTA